LVTGASTGIGHACALGLARAGFHVFAGVRRPADGNALQAHSAGRITPVILDVTDAQSIAAAADLIATTIGEAGLAGLVNNAGIAVAGPLEFVPIQELRRQFEVNVLGQVAVTQAMLPLLRQGRGRIVTMGSISGRLAPPFLGPYAASKHALEALTDSLRLELRPWRIHVAIVEPGSIATPIWEKSRNAAVANFNHAPAQAHALYDAAVGAAQARVEQTVLTAAPPRLVVQAVLHALTAPRPRTRYLVGRGARLQALVVKLAPDRLRDWLVASSMRLPRS
jgi:NAD(P)-dependent dehydrogenase (short-subunit alcohol dehydrogenase family)